MKRMIAVLLIAVMTLSFAACVKNAEKPAGTVGTPAAAETSPAPETQQPEPDPAQAILGTWVYNEEATVLGLTADHRDGYFRNMPDDYQNTITLNAEGTGTMTTVSRGETYHDAFTYKLQNNLVLAMQFDNSRVAYVFTLAGDRLSLNQHSAALLYDRK